MTGIDWLERWRQGRIGFHRDTPHPALIEHWPSLSVGAGDVLVPLCGKSPDMRWLASRGHAVVGIELSPLAVEQFLAQREAPVTRGETNRFTWCRQERVELWCGDFFHFDVAQHARLAGFYDRAALIALPAPTRLRYAHHLAQLLLPGSQGLLITLTHEGGEGGPPFSVDAEEVQRLLSPNFEIRLLDQGNASEDGICESVWHLVRRGPVNAA